MIFHGGIFAYKTSMGIKIFVLSAGMSLIIVFLPVGYQSVKAALTNLANSIRNE
jgi:Zn-dependent membrane protease YugP